MRRRHVLRDGDERARVLLFPVVADADLERERAVAAPPLGAIVAALALARLGRFQRHAHARDDAERRLRALGAALHGDREAVELRQHEVGEPVAVEIAHALRPVERVLRIGRLPQEVRRDEPHGPRLAVRTQRERAAGVEEHELLSPAREHVAVRERHDVARERKARDALELRPLDAPRFEAPLELALLRVQRDQHLARSVAVEVGERHLVRAPARFHGNAAQRGGTAGFSRGERAERGGDREERAHPSVLSSRSASPRDMRKSHSSRRRHAAGVLSHLTMPRIADHVLRSFSFS
jgi:hypothetical protein